MVRLIDAPYHLRFPLGAKNGASWLRTLPSAISGTSTSGRRFRSSLAASSKDHDRGARDGDHRQAARLGDGGGDAGESDVVQAGALDQSGRVFAADEEARQVPQDVAEIRRGGQRAAGGPDAPLPGGDEIETHAHP